MKFLAQITIPHEPFNTFVRDGTVGQKINHILEETKPESVYFTQQKGGRGCIAIYELSKMSDVPSVAEPWFLTFNADAQLNICMTPQDLKNAKLDTIGKKWA